MGSFCCAGLINLVRVEKGDETLGTCWAGPLMLQQKGQGSGEQHLSPAQPLTLAPPRAIHPTLQHWKWAGCRRTTLRASNGSGSIDLDRQRP